MTIFMWEIAPLVDSPIAIEFPIRSFCHLASSSFSWTPPAWDLSRLFLGAEWTEGIVLRYGAFYGPGTSMAPDEMIARQLRVSCASRAGCRR